MMGNDVAVFNKLEEEILELYSQGKTKEDIANELDIPLNVVRRVFYKPKVREKLTELIEAREVLLKEKHLELLEKLTDEMVQEAMEKGDLKSLLSKGRDILDVMSLTNTLLKEQEKRRLNTGEQNVIVNILQQLSGDSDE
jgi:hypothetical protein